MNTIQFLPPREAVLRNREAILVDLSQLIPVGCLIQDERELVPFETDAFVSYKRMPLAVVLPETTQQVAAVLGYCNQNGIPVVPRGAGTSLCGGAIPQKDAIIIGLSRLTQYWTSIIPIVRPLFRRVSPIFGYRKMSGIVVGSWPIYSAVLGPWDTSLIPSPMQGVFLRKRPRISPGMQSDSRAFIALHRLRFSVRTMCRLLLVHPSGFYAWPKNPLSKRANEDKRQTDLLLKAWEESGKVYGYRKPPDDLWTRARCAARTGVRV